jgi:hypothetical protein
MNAQPVLNTTLEQSFQPIEPLLRSDMPSPAEDCSVDEVCRILARILMRVASTPEPLEGGAV